ncbi:hypothetical protein [Paenibacillus agri]|uniref:Replication origin-binding protein domain-containing protein n=1 Tax=Paenibacillus agri TaxID=2744309 RepID=A0A850ET25_9BACL|nr:hypothetical protein [Paenibacillus agri]NUU62474.1 hypothetical protein [Paenibacillus agri]
MSSSLLSSKINIPHSKTPIVERTTLHRSLQNSALKKVTILRAPAGYGKTTTLSHWLQQVQGKMAWISIEPGDNDPIRYWSYILHAVAKACQTNIVEVLAPLLHSQDPAALEFFVHSFIEEIYTLEDSLHIVIDDYHFIHDAFIHRLMTQLIERLPEQAHVYLTTRTTLPLPVAKWRVKQWVHEINTE